MKLSIIVPVYNVERYLERCVQSIVAQAIDDCEILLVDDGSTDHSGTLCDELKRLHTCIEVIHQENGGLSAARNRGIEEAQGQYITFVDSDDELCPGTLKENMEFLMQHPEVDLLEYPVEVHADSKQAYLLSFGDETRQTDIFADWIRRKGYRHCYAWNKIYRAQLWSGIQFPRGEYYEDTAIMPHIIKRCRGIHYSSRGCYRYIMHEGTITTSYTYQKQRQLLINNHRLYMCVREHEALRTDALQLWICCLNLLIDLGRCFDADRIDYASLVEEMGRCRPSYRALLAAAPDKGTRLKLLPLPIVGLRTYCHIYTTLTKTLKA